MNCELITVERKSAAMWITLNRPKAANTFKPPHTFREIRSVFDSVREDRSVKALVITGAGDQAFCMGSDLGMLQQAFASRNYSLFRDYLQDVNAFLFELEDLPVPTVAMVQGRARAGGFELLLACDFVLIATEALVGDVHTPFGHMPGAGAT
jgi:enoyl-CoA hydratase/carnithine racemase